MRLPDIEPSMPLIEAAVLYGSHGLPVVPMHSSSNGSCSCSAGSRCKSPGKHPRTERGVHDGTSDETQIRTWWESWPEANVGIAVPRNVVVLDVDSDGAFEALREHGFDLSSTARTQSSSGRAHYWFTTDLDVKSSVGIVPGLDVRSHGSIVVAPPSQHHSGAVYSFSNGLTIVPAPESLANIVEVRGASPRARSPLGSILDGVNEGIRDSWLFRQACRLVAKGLHEEEQEHFVLLAADKCRPPFSRHRALRKIEAARAFAKVAYRLTDVGNAERFVAMHGDDLRYCRSVGWLVWDGRRWARDETGEVLRRARETARMVYAQAANEPDAKAAEKTFKWARASESVNRLKAMVEVAQSSGEIVVRPEDLDQDPMLFNVLNGTIDLRHGSIRRHERRDLITKLAGAHYDKTAKADLWLTFLERVTAGNVSLRNFLQRAVGYSLTADIGEHVLFLLYGTGANGKSTFLETLRSLFGEYAMQAEFSTFTSGRAAGSAPRNDLARLQGARLVSAVEMEAGSYLAESVVKQLTGGDTVSARYLYKEFFEFKPQFKLFLAANHRPNVRQTDDGIWRRILFVPFTVTIPPADRDKKLTSKLSAELPGILNWALEGAAAWHQSGLSAPEEVVHATNDYREDNDPLADFVEARCVVGAEHRIPFQQLYSAYYGYCEANHENPLGPRQFGEILSEKGFTAVKGTNGRRFRKGISLADPNGVPFGSSFAE